MKISNFTVRESMFAVVALIASLFLVPAVSLASDGGSGGGGGGSGRGGVITPFFGNNSGPGSGNGVVESILSSSGPGPGPSVQLLQDNAILNDQRGRPFRLFDDDNDVFHEVLLNRFDGFFPHAGFIRIDDDDFDFEVDDVINNRGPLNLENCVRTLRGNLTIADILNLNLPSTTTLADACLHLAGGIGTVDTMAPVISNLSITPNISGAMITWMTNELADSTVFFSVASSTGASVGSMVRMDNNLVFSHRIDLTNLPANTMFRVVVQSRDASGNVATSEERTFTTLMQ